MKFERRCIEGSQWIRTRINDPMEHNYKKTGMLQDLSLPPCTQSQTESEQSNWRFTKMSNPSDANSNKQVSITHVIFDMDGLLLGNFHLCNSEFYLICLVAYQCL